MKFTKNYELKPCYLQSIDLKVPVQFVEYLLNIPQIKLNNQPFIKFCIQSHSVINKHPMIYYNAPKNHFQIDKITKKLKFKISSSTLISFEILYVVIFFLLFPMLLEYIFYETLIKCVAPWQILNSKTLKNVKQTQQI